MRTFRQDTTPERDPATNAHEGAALTTTLGDRASPPVGVPVDMPERLERALKTTDPEVLRDAEAAYRGVHESEHAYIVARVAEHLQPPDLGWLLACCEPNTLREGYEGRTLIVWSIALDDGGCMVFESRRAAPDVPRLLGLVPATE